MAKQNPDNKHYDIATISKPVMVKTFGLTEAVAKLIHKHRKVFNIIYDAENLDTGIDARTLWDELGQPHGASHFTHWFDQQIENLLLVKGVDYDEYFDNEVFAKNGEKSKGRGRPQRNYIVTVTAAKELCLSAKGEQGKAYRQWFIAAEKLLRQLDRYNPPRMLSKDNQKKLKHFAAKEFHGFNNEDFKSFIACVNSMVCYHSTGARPKQWVKIGKPNPQDWLGGEDMEKYRQVQDVTIKAALKGLPLGEISNSLDLLYPAEDAEVYQKALDI